MLYIKIHAGENGLVVAMCDEAILGKILEEGEIFMDLKTYSDFYKGKLVDRYAAEKIIAEEGNIFSANVVGKEAVAVAINMKIIEEENIKKVNSVPYAQAFNLNV